MNSSGIKLAFNCKENWNKMVPIIDGKFCEAFKEALVDYTNAASSIIENKFFACGIYKAAQLEKPFGDWRDRLMNSYQKNKLINKKIFILKKAISFLLLAALFLSGCINRTFMGKRITIPANKSDYTTTKNKEFKKT